MLFISVSLVCFVAAVSASNLEDASDVEISQFDTAPAEDEFSRPTVRVPAKKFSGPSHMQFYSEFCVKFSSSEVSYAYTLCPFHNLTQLDLRVGDAPDIIIGTWQGWIVENNTYMGWHFYAGDPCNGVSREAKVMFKCGSNNSIVSVSESEKCHYLLSMQSPSFCNPDALLVYPFLPKDARNKWDVLETQKARGQINKQAYDELLHLLFAQHGLVLTEDDKDVYAEIVEKEEPKKFDSLETCEKEFHLLKQENDILKSMSSKDSLQNLEEQMAQLRVKQLEDETEGRHMREGIDYDDYRAHGLDYQIKQRDL